MATTNNNPVQNKEKLKKILVISVMGIVCACCLWWIYAPSQKETEKTVVGLNTSIPDPNEGDIWDNKKTAYERESMGKDSEDRMFSLDDYTSSLMIEQESLLKEIETVQEEKKEVSKVENSVSALRDINRTLENVYQYDNRVEQEQELLELTWRVQELEKKLEVADKEQKLIDSQLEMMERSFQIASQYMPKGQETVHTPIDNESNEKVRASSNTKVKVSPVSGFTQGVVSSLTRPLTGEEVERYFSSTRNMQFYTVSSEDRDVQRNTISACIHRDQTLISGQYVVLRLLEPLWIDGIILPVNTLVSGVAKLQGERMDIQIDAVEYKATIFPVKLSVRDIDGGRGLYIPGSEELDAMKEILANMGNTAGTSITVTDNVGSQLAADMTKGLIQGSSRYFQKKVRAVKVHVKAGHKVLLFLENA